MGMVQAQAVREAMLQVRIANKMLAKARRRFFRRGTRVAYTHGRHTIFGVVTDQAIGDHSPHAHSVKIRAEGSGKEYWIDCWRVTPPSLLPKD